MSDVFWGWFIKNNQAANRRVTKLKNEGLNLDLKNASVRSRIGYCYLETRNVVDDTTNVKYKFSE